MDVDRYERESNTISHKILKNLWISYLFTSLNNLQGNLVIVDRDAGIEEMCF